jgi:hypothetical protein
MKKIFFTYSDNSRDIELYKEFNKHFKTYAKKGLLVIMDKDESFRISNDKEKTLAFFRESDFAVPLLSVDYMTSEECMKLLDIAAEEKKPIIPVLLRDCDWDEMERIKNLADQLLPEDKLSVIQHIEHTEGGQDQVFSNIAKRVKGIVFKELDEVEFKSGSKTFYYILSGIVLIVGSLVTMISQTKWHDWKISSIIFLMFATIVLLALKNVLFPTKFKMG